jgi:glycosyltransferase involved in cell wall biosynthesis/uncharacterized protein (UPF0335 family)
MQMKASSKRNLKKISIISSDIVGKKMAGPGIRFYEFSKVLSGFMDVTLHTPNKVDIEIEGFRTKRYNLKNPDSLMRNIDDAEMILIQGHLLYYFPMLKNFPGKIIVDLYNPFNLESLEMFSDRDIAERLRIDYNNNNLIKLQLAIGDYFICASEKQRDYWTGMLSAMGRINTYNYDKDYTFRDFIDIVPFGIPSEPPVKSGFAARSIIPGIKEDDKLVLWGGGIWNWLDPITVIKAMWEVSRTRDDIKLIFMGVKHPDPRLPEMRKCLDAIKLSRELGLYNDKIFFNEWTPYSERQALLLESDAGLSIHLERIETEFSYRTRVMDYIWAGIPIITTEGDSIAKMVKEENIGEVVKYEDATQLSRVIESVLSNKSLQDIYRKNLKKIRHRFFWENITKPLIKYCRNPYFAADKEEIQKTVEFQNSRFSRIIKKEFEGTTNVLMITKDMLRDKKMVEKGDVGKIFYLEVEGLKPDKKSGDGVDEIGMLKSRINQRTKFDGVIAMNPFDKVSPRLFYDLVSVIEKKLKKGGLLFITLPFDRGLSSQLKARDVSSNTMVDDFTASLVFKEAGFEILDKGTHDLMEKFEQVTGNEKLGEIYGSNELFELFEIGLDRSDFQKLELLGSFDILESEELKNDTSLKGKFKRYAYLLTSMYFENMRKSYNKSMMNLSNNIHLQINNEINELNRKNRERMLLIYFNVFRTLYNEIKGLGYDIKSINSLLDSLHLKKKSKAETSGVKGKLEAVMRDLEHIDVLLGLSVSHRYYLVKKK